MTWGDFTDAVIEELGTDGNRRGIEALRTRAMRDAVIDLQRYIRAFRQGHTTIYNEADLTAKDWAHLGTLPVGAKPKAFYVVSQVPDADDELPDPDCARNRLDYCAWPDRRVRMICNRYGVREYLYAISPFGTQFMVHPLVNDETYLEIVWDGLKMDFSDGDNVPWPEHAAEAVAAYVKWKILLEIDRRMDLAAEWFDKRRGTGVYPSLRLALSREQREALDASNEDEEYDASDAPTPVPLANFGAQAIPFLSTVTQLSGVDGDTTALSAITTVSLSVPYVVQISIGGVIQTWSLQTSTAATGAGVQRPNDYADPSNTKVWIQVG